jgi:hypothetical protein
MHALSSWRALNEVLHLLDEGEVQNLIDTELGGRRRARFVKRLHQRYCVLRRDRELLELLGRCAA